MTAPWDPHGILGQPGIRMLRQSTMGSGDICMQRMGFDLDDTVPHGTGEARIVGTSYHAGLERYYRARMNGDHPTMPTLVMGEMLECAANAFNREVDDHPDLVWATTKTESWERVRGMLAAYIEGEHFWPAEYEVCAVEQEWFLPLPDKPGWALKGAIDLVLFGLNGYVLADHKTAGRKWQKGKESPHKSVQVPTYWWAFETITGERPYAFAFDVMTYKGEFDRRWVAATPPQLDALLRKARAYAGLLEKVALDELPTNPSSNLCSALYCDHWDRCPGGAVAAEVS